mmetsp:Transcript_87890/g.253509  ORF Transcript_87890/g.253509 Transcript_87890/m.253509 type:complete len:454 (+) Transcript_87890:347-1708(+)
MRRESGAASARTTLPLVPISTDGRKGRRGILAHGEAGGRHGHRPRRGPAHHRRRGHGHGGHDLARCQGNERRRDRGRRRRRAGDGDPCGAGRGVRERSPLPETARRRPNEGRWRRWGRCALPERMSRALPSARRLPRRHRGRGCCGDVHLAAESSAGRRWAAADVRSAGDRRVEVLRRDTRGRLLGLRLRDRRRGCSHLHRLRRAGRRGERRRAAPDWTPLERRGAAVDAHRALDVAAAGLVAEGGRVEPLLKNLQLLGGHALRPAVLQAHGCFGIEVEAPQSGLLDILELFAAIPRRRHVVFVLVRLLCAVWAGHDGRDGNGLHRRRGGLLALQRRRRLCRRNGKGWRGALRRSCQLQLFLQPLCASLCCSKALRKRVAVRNNLRGGLGAHGNIAVQRLVLCLELGRDLVPRNEIRLHLHSFGLSGLQSLGQCALRGDGLCRGVGHLIELPL